jgi:hypothetical protein
MKCDQCETSRNVIKYLNDYIECLKHENTHQGLLGEKVVWSEKYLKRKFKSECMPEPLPECGYFIITKAVLKDDGGVMVALHPYKGSSFLDGTNINLCWLKKYEEDKNNKD